MSTLNLATLNASAAVKTPSVQDAAGANPSTPQQLQQGRAKAWINFDGTGTIATRDSFNISSIVDNGVGDYTENFAVAMPGFNYTCNPNPRVFGISVSVSGNGPLITVATGFLRFATYYVSSTGGAGTASDYPSVCDAVFGD